MTNVLCGEVVPIPERVPYQRFHCKLPIHIPFSEGEDYTSTSGTLTFSGGDSSLRLEVAIRDDAVVEYSERFIVALSAPETESGVRLAEPRRVVVTITNDDSEKFNSIPTT